VPSVEPSSTTAIRIGHPRCESADDTALGKMDARFRVQMPTTIETLLIWGTPSRFVRGNLTKGSLEEGRASEAASSGMPMPAQEFLHRPPLPAQ